MDIRNGIIRSAGYQGMSHSSLPRKVLMSLLMRDFGKENYEMR